MARIIIAKGGVYNLTQGQHKRLVERLTPATRQVLDTYTRLCSIDKDALLVSYIGSGALGIVSRLHQPLTQPKGHKGASTLAANLGHLNKLNNKGNVVEYTNTKVRAYVCHNKARQA